MLADPRVRRAFLASLLLHVAFGGLLAARVHAESRREPEVRREVWSGETFEVDALKSELHPPAGVAAAEQAAATPASEPEPVSIEKPRPPAGQPVPLAPKQPDSAERRSPAPGREVVRKEAVAGGSDATERASYGAVGLPPGVRDLAKAFTRAIPPATRADPIWGRLPLGPAGSMRCKIELDAEGRIVAAEPDEKTLPTQLRNLLERTVLLLKSGQFALRGAQVQSGSQVLKVQALLLHVGADESYGDSNHVMSMQFEPPSLHKPGKAAFQTGSGRRVEVTVSIEAINVASGSRSE